MMKYQGRQRHLDKYRLATRMLVLTEIATLVAFVLLIAGIVWGCSILQAVL